MLRALSQAVTCPEELSYFYSLKNLCLCQFNPFFMSLSPVFPANAAKPAAFYSPAMDTGDLILFSGQVALTPSGEFLNDSLDTELTQVFENIDALLDASGTRKTQIAKVTIYLADMNDYAEMNERYMQYMDGHAPARTCIQVAALPLGATVEIEVMVKK